MRGRGGRARRAERGGEVHAAPRASWASGRSTAASCGSPTRCGSPTTARISPRCRRTRRCTTSSPTSARTGAAGRSRATSAASGSRGDSVQRRAGTLSGGERARVALAMMMLSGANLLDLRRAHQSSRRRVDRGAGGRDRGLRRHGAAREPRSRVAPRAHDPGLGAARRPDHRLSRRLRGMGDGERGARARRRGRGGRGGVAPPGARSGSRPAVPRTSAARADGATDGGAGRRGGGGGGERVGGAGGRAAGGARGSRTCTSRAEGAKRAGDARVGRWRRRAARLDEAFARWEAATREAESAGLSS